MVPTSLALRSCCACQASQGCLTHTPNVGQTHIPNVGLTHIPHVGLTQIPTQSDAYTKSDGSDLHTPVIVSYCSCVTYGARESDGLRVQVSTPEKPAAAMGAAVTSGLDSGGASGASSSGNKSKSSGGGGMDLMADLKARLNRRRSGIGGADAQV